MFLRIRGLALAMPRIWTGCGSSTLGSTKQGTIVGTLVLVGGRHFSQFGSFASSINETFDVDRDSGSPVSGDCESPNPFDMVRKKPADFPRRRGAGRKGIERRRCAKYSCVDCSAPESIFCPRRASTGRAPFSAAC